MRLINILFFVLLIFVNSLSANDYNPQQRPTDKPTKVEFRIFIADIESIDNIGQKFSTDFFLRLVWEDKRLIGRVGAIPINEIWNPYIQIFNSRDVDIRLPEVATVFEGGKVRYVQRYYGTFASMLNFKNFPFDTQTLELKFLSLAYSDSEIEFVLDTHGKTENYSLSGWTLERGVVSIKPIVASFDKGNGEEVNRAAITFSMNATRHISFYWYKVVAPMTIIVLLSWAVFFIDPSQVGAQVGVSATSILTLIAFLLRLENLIPPISYLTVLDYFIFITLFLVFLAYLEALVSTSFALGGKKEIALKMDFWSRFIFPAVFLLIIVLFWIL